MYVMVRTRVDCICNESNVPIHVKGWSTTLDGCKMRHEVFERHFNFALCLGNNNVALRGYYNADWIEDANNQRSIMGSMFFVGIGVILWKCKNTNHCNICNKGQSTWPLAIAWKKQFDLNNFLGM